MGLPEGDGRRYVPQLAGQRSLSMIHAANVFTLNFCCLQTLRLALC